MSLSKRLTLLTPLHRFLRVQQAQRNLWRKLRANKFYAFGKSITKSFRRLHFVFEKCVFWPYRVKNTAVW